MPRPSKGMKDTPNHKGRRAHRQAAFSTSTLAADISLNDFANCGGIGPGKSRMKKASANSIVRQVKDMCKDQVDDRDWFEKDLEDFHIDSPAEEDEDDTVIRYSKTTKARRKKLNSSSSISEEDRTGNEYPIDIWFILGDYIVPEDVGRFAGICKSSNAVTNTIRFWSRLYKRYLSDPEVLPIRLQPECMERPYGLRTCVIRSLYYLYPVFRSRNKTQEPHSLIKRNCTMLWHQKGRGAYHFFFKLKEPSEYWEEDTKGRGNQPDLIEMLGDMNANSEKGCKVLQVTCRTPANVPPVLGQTLLSVSTVLSSDLRTHCLRLIFGPPHAIHYCKPGRLTFSHIPEGSLGVCIDSVIMVKVIDWYHRDYPHHSQEIKSSLNDNSGSQADDNFF